MNRKKHIITIAGQLGSGKSSTAKKVANILDYTHYSTGDMMRAIAAEKGMTLAELSTLAENDMSIDKKLDDRNTEIGQMQNIVLDSRLGFHFIPDAFKVYLDLDEETAAERILDDKIKNLNRNNEDSASFDTKENIIESIAKRHISEKKRYKDLYHIEDPTSHSNFDLVLNTKKIPLEEVSKIVVEEYNKWLAK